MDAAKSAYHCSFVHLLPSGNLIPVPSHVPSKSFGPPFEEKSMIISSSLLYFNLPGTIHSSTGFEANKLFKEPKEAVPMQSGPGMPSPPTTLTYRPSIKISRG